MHFSQFLALHLLLQRYEVDKPANATSTHCAEGRADSSLWVIYMKRFTITTLYARIQYLIDPQRKSPCWIS